MYMNTVGFGRQRATHEGNHIAEARKVLGSRSDPRQGKIQTGILLNYQGAHSPGGYTKIPTNSGMGSTGTLGNHKRPSLR